MLPTKFQVNWPFGSGEEVKSIFSRWPPRQPSWISDRNDFSYFCSTSHPNASYQVSSLLAFRFRRRSENWFSRWPPHSGYLGIPIGTILAIFDLQVTPMLPAKFQVSWLLGSGEEAKNKFSRWRPWRPSWISDRKDFSYFLYNQGDVTLPLFVRSNPFSNSSEIWCLSLKSASFMKIQQKMKTLRCSQAFSCSKPMGPISCHRTGLKQFS